MIWPNISRYLKHPTEDSWMVYSLPVYLTLLWLLFALILTASRNYSSEVSLYCSDKSSARFASKSVGHLLSRTTEI